MQLPLPGRWVLTISSELISIIRNWMQLVKRGASKTLNSKSANAVADLQKFAESRLMAVIDTFGGESTGQLAVRALAKSGQYLLVGQAGGDFKMPASTKSYDGARQPCGQFPTVTQADRYGEGW